MTSSAELRPACGGGDQRHATQGANSGPARQNSYQPRDDLTPEELHQLVAEARGIDGLLDNFRVSKSMRELDRRPVYSDPHPPSIASRREVQQVRVSFVRKGTGDCVLL